MNMIQTKTAEIYGNLFTQYTEKLFDESVELFSMRHRRWGIDLDWFKGRICLDAGCGGGRYLVALNRLGAKEVRGIDISEQVVDVANERLAARGFQKTAQVASVLAVPFSGSYFDYVVSSGVIHHTPDPLRAFSELARVLKPGGKLFLSVYGRGGLKWIINDLFRNTICKIVPFRIMEKIFTFIGVPANKRYNILDNLYVEYCFRFTEKEIKKWLNDGGFTNIRRLKFERYDYETLRSRIIHGEGWIQIYADKK